MVAAPQNRPAWDVDPFAPKPAAQNTAPTPTTQPRVDPKVAAAAGAVGGYMLGTIPVRRSTVDELAEVGAAWLLFLVIVATPPTINAGRWIGYRLSGFMDSRAAGFLGLKIDGTNGDSQAANADVINRVVAEAESWIGRDYRPGVTERCAEWVRVVLEAAGVEVGVGKGSAGPLMADSFYGPEMGEIILDAGQLKRGDIIMFADTYDGGGRSPIEDRGRITHVGIMIEDGAKGAFVDRSTMSAPVRKRTKAETGFRFHSALRPHAYKTSGESASHLDAAAAFIKTKEGFSPTPYWDHAQYTWGYGTKAPGPIGSIGESQAEQELIGYLQAHCAPLIDPAGLNAEQYAAASSLCYNLGPAQFKTSHVYQGLQSGDTAAAANGFDERKWMRASGQQLEGLVNRRAAEKELFNSGN